MALRTKKASPRSPHSKKQREILKALETVARRSGLKVSSGQLRFAGLRLKGGSCFLRGRQWLVLDKNQPFEELLDIYREALPLEALLSDALPDELSALLSPYLPPPVSVAAAGERAA